MMIGKSLSVAQLGHKTLNQTAPSLPLTEELRPNGLLTFREFLQRRDDGAEQPQAD